ncbi:MAG: amidohydrolase family protein, partial [Rhizomicrobium sp.]
QQTAHTYDGPVRIRNVHVFDPATLQTGPLSSVVLYRDRITTVEPDGAPAVTDGETIIDGQGGTLVTGMHDMHAHVSAWDGPLLIAGGVTTVRDLGNNNVNLQAMIRSIDSGALIGPHIIPSGFIEGRSPYSARDGIVIATQDEGLRAVRWYADRGYNQIKIYNSMNPAFVASLAAEAHRLGLRVVGHVPAFATPDQMIEAGYNEITHVNQLMLGWLLKPGEDTRTPLRLTAMARAADLDLNSMPVQHTLDLMRQHNVGWDTTISIVEQLMMSRAGEVPANAAAYIDHLPIGVQRYKKRSYINFKDDAEKATYDTAFHKALATMALFHNAGIKLWPGTDAANGFTLHRELELYMQAGMSAAVALRIATYDCDAYLGRDQNFGTIARGKQADFFLVPGDPSKDLSQLDKIRMVVKGGTIYYPSEIYQAYGITPFAPPPPVVAASGDAK